MNRQQNGRFLFLDAAKGVGILAVMFGHITSLGNPVDRWISTFKLPIFFIVAGFLICYKEEVSTVPFGKFSVKRVRAMLLPYLYFSGIVILYRMVRAAFQGKGADGMLRQLLADLLDTFSFRGISALWFLPAIFIAEILFFFVMRARIAGKILAVIAASAVYVWTSPLLAVFEGYVGAFCYQIVQRPVLAVTKGVVGFLFIGCGYLLCEWRKKFPTGRGRLAAGVLLIFVGIFLSGFNRGSLDYNNMNFGEHPICFFFCALINSVGLIFVLESLEQYYPFPILTWCGRNSLILMATHGTLGFKSIMVNGWAKVMSLSQEVCLKYYLECMGILFHLVVFEYGVVEFVNRKMPFLLGRSKGKIGGSN